MVSDCQLLVILPFQSPRYAGLWSSVVPFPRWLSHLKPVIAAAGGKLTVGVV